MNNNYHRHTPQQSKVGFLYILLLVIMIALAWAGSHEKKPGDRVDETTLQHK